METSSSSNKRIAKNTMMLYIRMLLTMAVTLYTSRVVLRILGVEDYGIYNVVGGFVSMFALLNSAMANATQRFLSYEIGNKDNIQLRNVFSMSVNIHFVIAFVILLFAETIGLWFVNTQLTIPPERMVAALWVYQFSILTLMVNIVSVPYNAIIIAHERMNVFAGVSIVDVSLKLFIVFMLQWFGFDKLKLYAVLMFSVSLIIRLIYGVYCKYNFKESKFRFFWDKPLFKRLISYASWNLWGNAAVALYGQGVNVLLNIFFGPIVNAAAGIANQARGGVNSFVQNFQMAMNPQIIKSYASGDLKYMHQLIFSGAKYSFLLLFGLSLPILLETETVLRIWLNIVPEYTVIFLQLSLIMALINSLSGPLSTAAQATGKIKLFQGVVGGLLLLILPLSYLFFKLGFPPQITFIISSLMYLIALYARLKIASYLVSFSVDSYLKNVIVPIIPVTLSSIILPILLLYFLDEGITRFLLIILCSIICVLISIYSFGLQKDEKLFVNRKVKDWLASSKK